MSNTSKDSLHGWESINYRKDEDHRPNSEISVETSEAARTSRRFQSRYRTPSRDWGRSVKPLA